MSDRFCTVLAVHSAHRRGAAVDAAQRLADNASILLTSFDIAERGQADLVRTARSHDVQEIASAIKSRAGALLVVDALGGGPDADWLYDDDAEHLLANVPLPTLVFGPHATLDITRLILLVAADASGTTTASVAAAAVWAATFASTAIVVALDAPDPWPADGADPTVDPPRQLAAALADTGVTVE